MGEIHSTPANMLDSRTLSRQARQSRLLELRERGHTGFVLLDIEYLHGGTPFHDTYPVFNGDQDGAVESAYSRYFAPHPSDSMNGMGRIEIVKLITPGKWRTGAEYRDALGVDLCRAAAVALNAAQREAPIAHIPEPRSELKVPIAAEAGYRYPEDAGISLLDQD